MARLQTVNKTVNTCKNTKLKCFVKLVVRELLIISEKNIKGKNQVEIYWRVQKVPSQSIK